MDKVFQVFISSTFTDLRDERREVSNTLAKAGYVVAGMELFPATDQQQLEYIKRVIDRSDYYVVIVGGRYGSLADDTASFTEKEFEYAVSKGIPVLAFLHPDPRKLPVEKTDEDVRKADLLNKFRAKLSTGRIVERWTNTADLCMRVVIAVANAVNLTPGIGWVRGDQAIDPKLFQELERLRSENADLRKQLANPENNDLMFDELLLGPEDQFEIDLSIGPASKEGSVQKKIVSETYGRIYALLFDGILKVSAEFELRKSLERVVAGRLEIANENVKIENFRQLRDQFEALDLIRTVSRMHKRDTGLPTTYAFTQPNEYSLIHWEATEKGRRFVVRSRALKRQTPDLPSKEVQK